MHFLVDGVWEFAGYTLVVVNHRSVFGPGSHRWLAGEPERREVQPAKLPEVHPLEIPQHLISPKPNIKQTSYIFIR